MLKNTRDRQPYFGECFHVKGPESRVYGLMGTTHFCHPRNDSRAKNIINRIILPYSPQGEQFTHYNYYYTNSVLKLNVIFKCLFNVYENKLQIFVRLSFPF